MRAIDVGIGHDDDAGVPQILLAVMRSGAAADCLDQLAELRVRAQLVLGRGCDVEDLSSQGKDRLGTAVARVLGASARRVALDDEQLRPLGRGAGAVGEFTGQPCFLYRGLAGNLLFGAAAQPVVRLLDHEIK